MQQHIEKVVGPDVTVLSSAEETAKEVGEWLEYHNQLNNSGELPHHIFHTTGSVPIFRTIAEKWLEKDHLDIRRIKL